MHSKMTSSDEVVIVGAGIAGLSAALLLQHSGVQVTVLESHDKVGGCAGYFSASDWTFPTGATVIMGLEVGGIHRQIFDIIGATLPDASGIDGLRVVLPDRSIFWGRNAGKWRVERRKLGGNRHGQEVFWKMQEIVADAGWRALSRHPSLPLQDLRDVQRNLKLVDPRLASLAPAQLFSTAEIMRVLGVHRDKAFRSFVELGLIITTQSSARDTPFLNGAAGLDLWRHGAFHITGGAGELARCMSTIFVERGGRLLFRTRAVRLERSKAIWKVVTTRGEFEAPFIAWNGGIQSLRDVLSETESSTIEEQIECEGEQWGAVNLYCAVRDEGIPSHFGLHTQVLCDYRAKAGDGKDVFLSLSLPDDEQQAPRGWRSLNVSTHTKIKDWEGLDAKMYRAQKKRWRERLLNGVRVALPNLDENTKFVICGTPFTWERYTYRFRGGVGGFPLSRRNANLRSVSSRVAQGLWCIGDSVFPGQGTVAAALSGLNFWRDVTD